MTEVWNRMPYRLFAADKRMTAMLTNTVFLQNIIQEKELTAVKPQILQYLRTALHNSTIQLQFQITAQDHGQVAYTEEERFKLLSKENPHLLEMKEMLKLILD